MVTLEQVPSGTTRTLIDQPGVPALGSFGCSSDGYDDVALDDEGAGGFIENLCAGPDDLLGSPPAYRPNQDLSAFDGLDAQGEWRLTVSDVASGFQGAFESWTLSFDRVLPACP